MGSADSARCGKRDCPQYQRDTTRRLFGRVKSLNSQRSFLNSLQLETTLGDLLLVNLTGPQDGFGDKSFNRISLVIVKMNYMGMSFGTVYLLSNAKYTPGMDLGTWFEGPL